MGSRLAGLYTSALVYRNIHQHSTFFHVLKHIPGDQVWSFGARNKHSAHDQVRFLVGWFKDTLPAAPIDRLAVLRLDGDYYESTMDTLTALYDKVSPGGFVIIDDYGERLWTYCRRAVDDFRRARSITAELIKVDTKCYFWQKPA